MGVNVNLVNMYAAQVNRRMLFRTRVIMFFNFVVAVCNLFLLEHSITRSLDIAEGLRDASCQLKSCQLPRNSAETTYTTSPDQIDGMKLEI